MKLRTRLVPLGSRTSVDYRNAGDAAHDLLAAHAYKQAINDWHEKNGTGPDEDVYPEETVAFIEKRAAEILAGWMGGGSGMSGDTDCRKCKAPMRDAPSGLQMPPGCFVVTGYLCAKCGHWNNLKRRKKKEQEVE